MIEFIEKKSFFFNFRQRIMLIFTENTSFSINFASEITLFFASSIRFDFFRAVPTARAVWDFEISYFSVVMT